MDPIEVVAAIFGFLCVVLTIYRSIWCWPTGLVQVFLYIYVFFGAKLYSDMILHIIYVFMQIYGWYHWRSGAAEKELPITTMGRWFPISILLGLAVTFFWGLGMERWTDAALPYADAFTTVMSLIAQWLLARKKLESWIFWIAVDVVAVFVYAYRGLQPTTILYAVFLGLAVAGLLQWHKVWSASQAEADQTKRF